jgi:hypothetical protein
MSLGVIKSRLFYKLIYVFKKLVKTLFRGDLELSNDISPSKIGYFLLEI